MKTLEKARAYWENSGQIVAHYDMTLKHGCRVTIMAYKGQFTLIRYFTIADVWHASCDVSMAGASVIFDRLAEMSGAVKEGE